MENDDEKREMKQSEPNNIELRSEKVRNIIGEMPTSLLRWGNVILWIIFILLIAIVVSLFVLGDASGYGQRLLFSE